MPSSTSSSDPGGTGRTEPGQVPVPAGADPSVAAGTALMQPGKPGDDPRIGEGPVERPLPALPLGRALLIALLVLLLGVLAWEWYWRDFGAVPSYRNSDGQWAEQRRRIDRGEGDALVIIGDSRTLFDINLDVWERLSGERPIQLSLEGTSAMFALEDLAADPDFTGRLIVGLAPDLFFSGYGMRAGVLEHYRNETPAQRAGEWLSMQLLEPTLAFFDPDFALPTVLARQAWPQREGVTAYMEVRKLSLSGPDRNTWMWDKVERDPVYREMARGIWAQFLPPTPVAGGPPPDAETQAEIEGFRKTMQAQIAKAASAVEALRARGVEVVFVRPPSCCRYLEFEQAWLPRAETWDVLLSRTGAPGIHFEDHPDMQGLELPEWSHLSAAAARRYTAALYRAWTELPRPPG